MNTIMTARRMPAARRLVSTAALVAAALGLTVSASMAQPAPQTLNFNRISTFEVHRNLPAGADPKTKSLAEIVAVSADGRTLAYTDGAENAIGFIDISDPAAPKPVGLVKVGGEATSVAIAGSSVFAAVDTSPSKDRPSGRLVTLDLATRTQRAVCELGGQPDSVAVSKDLRFLAIIIENERDETKDKGKMPQLPSGNLTIVPLRDGVADCDGKRVVELAGIAAFIPEDAEPEFVDINDRNEAVVTLQENNHMVVVDLATGRVLSHFSAGTVTIDKIDLKRDGIISATERAENLKREPDAVKWLDDNRFVTANEGDYEGGSRGFTIFRKDGSVEWDSGSSFEHLAMRIGHYPDRRSNAKGSEPEGVEVARFGDQNLIFIGSERGSFVAVYRDRGPGQAPEYLQVLPAGVGPEGIVAIPGRNLLAVSAEVDGVADGRARSSVMLYQLGPRAADYPQVISVDRANGTPIPFGALSALSADSAVPGRLYTITDSAYADTRILTLDATQTPARIIAELPLKKDGKQASYDAEGLVQRSTGGFWVATEGDPEKKLRDMLLRVAPDGTVEEEITLPEALASQAARFGFEGVTVTGSGEAETVWLAVQREWKDDPKGLVKILSYKPLTKAWGVLHYPLSPAKQGSWIGLSEIVAIDDQNFAVIERDNLFGDGSFKTIQRFSIAGLTPAIVGATTIPAVTKTLVRDLGADLAAGKGYIVDKVEGMTVDKAGNLFVITDNDGVDGSNGETRFLRLGQVAMR